MRKSLMMFVAAVVLSVPAFASYWVVMKDGTRYQARSKPTVVNGKAIIQLESGPTIQVDPAMIDVAKSEEMTKLGGGKVIERPDQNQSTSTNPMPSLGSAVKLRKPGQLTSTETSTAPTSAGGPSLPNDVLERFTRAYENVGIFEQKVTSAGPHTVKAELTADSEEKVFNAISATAVMITKNAGLSGVQIDAVDLVMKTTTGGSAGRFMMSKSDAAALDGKQMTREEFFVRKVIY